MDILQVGAFMRRRDGLGIQQQWVPTCRRLQVPAVGHTLEYHLLEAL